MELYQLEQFMAIAQDGSMGEAAKRLYLSRAALSQNLKRLEQELGCELFSRKHNKLAITPYGEILLEHTRRIAIELDTALDRIEKEKRARDKTLRVGHFSMPLCYFKMPHLAHALPDWNFIVDIRGNHAVCQGLSSGDYDLIMVVADAPLPEGALTIPLEPEQACLSVPPTSKLYERTTVPLAELGDEGLLVTDDLTGVSLWYRSMVSASGLPEENVVTIPSDEYLSTMSESPLCHFSTMQMVDFFGLGNNRRAIPISDEIAKRNIVAAYLPDRKDVLKPVLRSLKEHRRERFGAYDIFPFLLMPGRVPNLEINVG